MQVRVGKLKCVYPPEPSNILCEVNRSLGSSQSCQFPNKLHKELGPCANEGGLGRLAILVFMSKKIGIFWGGGR